MEALITESLLKYYGLDWFTMFFGLYGTYFISKKSKWAFIFWMMSGGCALIVAYISMQYGFLVYNTIAIALYANSLRCWRRDEQQEFVAAE